MIQEVKVLLLLFIIIMIMADFLTLSYQCVFHVNFCFAFFLWFPFQKSSDTPILLNLNQMKAAKKVIFGHNEL